MWRKILILSVMSVFSFLFLSCDKQLIYNEFISIDNQSWEWDSPVDFSFQIDDTTTVHNIYLYVRHTVEYPVSNLYMFVDLEGPSGQALNDTINFILAKKSGEWIGNGISKTREIGYLYRKNTVFPEKGKYQISIEQAMRISELPVRDVGVRIEKLK